MTKLDDDRRMQLRGSYLDRIIESAQHYAATRTYFIDADFTSFIAGEFEYLRDLTDEERQYLRDQVGIESLRRVALARAQDRAEFFGQVIADNNDVVASDAEFSFDIGWLDLVRDAVARMRTYPASWRVRLDGGKEKFGCLVLFVFFDVEARGAMHEICRMREEFRLRSLATCDICGDAGRLRLGQWAKTTCDRHAAVLGEMREDDGLWADPYRWRDERPIEDHIATGRAVMAAVEETDLRKRIDDDTWSHDSRQQELLIEFGAAIEDVVNGAVVKEEFLDGYIAKEIDGWRTTAVVPVSERDREFLHGYLRELIDADRNK